MLKTTYPQKTSKALRDRVTDLSDIPQHVQDQIQANFDHAYKLAQDVIDGKRNPLSC